MAENMEAHQTLSSIASLISMLSSQEENQEVMSNSQYDVNDFDEGFSSPPPSVGSSTLSSQTREFEVEIFLEEVRKYSCLWDISSPNYKDRNMKSNAWKAISSVFGREGIKIFLCVLFFQSFFHNNIARGLKRNKVK